MKIEFLKRQKFLTQIIDLCCSWKNENETDFKPYIKYLELEIEKLVEKKEKAEFDHALERGYYAGCKFDRDIWEGSMKENMWNHWKEEQEENEN